jgi:hypothetical protein
MQLPFAERIRIARNGETTAQLETFRRFGEVATSEDAYVLTPAAGVRLSDFFAAVEQVALSYRFFSVTRLSLEDVFLQLTGKTLRDA